MTNLLSYLVAVNLHDWRPSSISTSKISNETENGNCCRAAKTERN